MFSLHAPFLRAFREMLIPAVRGLLFAGLASATQAQVISSSASFAPPSNLVVGVVISGRNGTMLDLASGSVQVSISSAGVVTVQSLDLSFAQNLQVPVTVAPSGTLSVGIAGLRQALSWPGSSQGVNATREGNEWVFQFSVPFTRVGTVSYSAIGLVCNGISPAPCQPTYNLALVPAGAGSISGRVPVSGSGAGSLTLDCILPLSPTNLQAGTLRVSGTILGVFQASGQACPADYSRDGSVGVQDIFDFLGGWFQADVRADFNLSGSVTVQDIFDFLTAWFVGC